MSDDVELLSKGQQRALDDALAGRNLFITGAGGVGKSFLIDIIKKKLEEKGKSVALTSSTGISAINIGGNTIHSFCGTGVRSNIYQIKKMPPETIARVRNFSGHFDVVIVDEVSMLSGDYIDMMDVWFQRIWKQQRAFGGRQMIFVGDFLQLPPVITQDDMVDYHFAFESDAWLKYDIREHFITNVFRQEDKETQYFLNCIRFGKVNKKVLDFFNKRVGVKLDEKFPTQLYPLKKSVSDINFRRLGDLPGDEHEYDASFTGEDCWQQAIAKNTIAEICLYLKEGASVLFIRNNPTCGYYNGMKGTVVKCKEESVIVATSDGEEIEVVPETWEKKSNDGKILATMKQIPLILGWAVTIHKSQGMTLDWMKCDLSLCFECGQAYVALSRIRNMDGLSIKKPIKKQDIKTSKKVVKYYRHLLTQLREEKEKNKI